jgi:hypothetical protein
MIDAVMRIYFIYIVGIQKLCKLMGYSGTNFARNSQDSSYHTWRRRVVCIGKVYRTTLLKEEFVFIVFFIHLNMAFSFVSALIRIFFVCAESQNEIGASILELPYVVYIDVRSVSPQMRSLPS